jgi:ATP-dependent DNA ligase
LKQTTGAAGWTVRLPVIAAGAALLKAKSFTIDGEAVVVGPDGLTDFEALRRRGAGEVAVLYAFDLIELGAAPPGNVDHPLKFYPISIEISKQFDL